MADVRNADPIVTGDPVDQVREVERCPPSTDAPVRTWAAWFDRLADLYTQIHDRDPALGLAFVANHYRRKATTLPTDHNPDRPWPTAAWWSGTSSTNAAPHRQRPRTPR